MAFRVLIVEDDAAFRKVVEIRLRGWKEDVDISSAVTLTEARKILDDPDAHFDLVILDQRLPDGAGPELFDHAKLKEAAVLAVSADEAPDIPGAALKAGAQHFLGKRQVTEPLFIPLVEALLARRKLEAELLAARIRETKMSTITVLLATLRHEINNPLGAVLGGAYLVRSGGTLDDDQKKALRLIEASGNRIKHVLRQLCDAAELEEVVKAQEPVFQVPGDAPWDAKTTATLDAVKPSDVSKKE